jgi:hypothetical protein
MIIRHKKDVVLFRMNAIEMRQVMEVNSMVHSVWIQFLGDFHESTRSKRWIPNECPLKVCHEENGRGHVLQCRVHLWRYFQEVDAANPLEREIRAELLSVGISGDADRRTARYGAPPRHDVLGCERRIKPTRL